LRRTDLAIRLKTMLPRLKIVYMTGYLEQGEENGEFLEEAFFLQKPFSREAMVRQVTEAVNSKAVNEPAKLRKHPPSPRTESVSV
jgi:FixJ family two-component response regulator